MAQQRSSPRRAARGPGRRPGNPDTRADILAAAREQFSRNGYTATSVRAIAAAAGVNSALVHHYFGTKDELLLAALDLPVDPREVLMGATLGGVDGAGHRLLTVFFSTWDDPDLQPRLVALARSIVDPSSHLVTSGYLNVILRPVAESLGVDRRDERITLVGSVMLGLILARYVLKLEPLASTPAQRLIPVYAPQLQRILSDPLP